MPAAVAPVTHPPCTAEERAALRCPLTSGGYHGVYLHTRDLNGRSAPSYVARPFRKLRIGAYPNPREAVAAVAAWWRTRFGSNWVEHFRHRNRPGWEAIPVPLGERPGWAAGFDLLDDAWGGADDIDGRLAARTGDDPPAVWTWKHGGWKRAGDTRSDRGEGFAAVAWPAGVPTLVHPPAAGGLFARPTDARHAVLQWVRAMAAAGTPVELLPARLAPPLPVDEGSHQDEGDEPAAA